MPTFDEMVDAAEKFIYSTEGLAEVFPAPYQPSEIISMPTNYVINPPQEEVSGDWANQINDLMDFTHHVNRHWWFDQMGEEAQKLVVPTKLMLIVSEIAEAMEGHRKSLNDDKLPNRPMIEVELADAMIRIMDLAGRLKLDLGGAYVEKMRFNMTREDHSAAARKAPNGKAY